MKCMIVEDDKGLSVFLCACLEDLGHTTERFATRKDAMHALKTRKYSLLLVDFHLTDGDSLPVIEYFSATNPNSRIILLTGSGVFPNGETSFLAPGVDWVLRKPVQMGDLHAVVDYAERDTTKTNPERIVYSG